MQWQSWSFQLGNKVFSQIRPITLEIRPEIKTVYKNYFLFYDVVDYSEETGQWELKLVYDSGPMSPKRTDVVVFRDEYSARLCYDAITAQVFLGQPAPTKQTPHKHPKPKNKSKPGLRLV